ncbi:MAG: hypothetical protein ACK5PQ_01450 [Alphaproteobacteria bacterium]
MPYLRGDTMLKALCFMIVWGGVAISAPMNREFYAQQFFSRNTKPLTKDGIRRAFGERSLEDYASICDQSQRVLKKLPKGTNKIVVISAVAGVPLDRRENVIDLLDIIEEGKGLTVSSWLYDFKALADTLSSHEPISVSQMVAFFQSPAGQKISSSKKEFIQKVIQIRVDVRPNVLALASRFLERQPEGEKHSPFYHFGEYSCSWLTILGRDGDELDEESLGYAFEFSEYLSEQVEIWAQFRRILPPDRPGIVSTIKELLPHLNFAAGIGKLVPAMVGLDTETRASFPQFVADFLQDDKGDSDLLTSLAKIGTAEKEEVLRLWRSLRGMIPPDRQYGVISTAKGFVEMEPLHRKLAYPLLEALISRGQWVGEFFQTLKTKMAYGKNKEEVADLLLLLRSMVENPGFDSIFQKGHYQGHPLWDKHKKHPTMWEHGGFWFVMGKVTQIPEADRHSVVRSFSQIVSKVPEGIGPNEDAESVMHHAFKELEKIPRIERDKVVSQTLELCPSLRKEDLWAHEKRFHPLFELISVLASFPPEERTEALRTFRVLNSQWHIKKPAHMAKILQQIRPLSGDARGSLERLVSQLFPLPLQGYFAEKTEIFKLASSLNREDIPRLVESVQAQISGSLGSALLRDAVQVMKIDLDGLRNRYFDETNIFRVLKDEVKRCTDQVDQVIGVLFQEQGLKREPAPQVYEWRID